MFCLLPMAGSARVFFFSFLCRGSQGAEGVITLGETSVLTEFQVSNDLLRQRCVILQVAFPGGGGVVRKLHVAPVGVLCR